MSKHDTLPDVPAPDQVRDALEHIITSETFRSSPQLASFLGFVVESVLHGKSDRIKGYTIGVEVLRRDIKFDPQIDPIVRVEATRLRRALERYYAGPGQTASVLIDLPRGSYVPTFRYRGEILDDPDAQVLLTRRAARTRWLAIASGIAVVVTAIGVASLFMRHRDGITPFSRVEPAQRFSPGNGMPTLMVQTFDVVGTPNSRSVSAPVLLDKVRDAFSRFDAINIVTATPAPDATIDYRLRGFVEYLDDGMTSVRFSLIDVSDGTVVWTRNFERLSAARERTAQEDTIAGGIATTLLQPFGVIRSRERSKYLVGSSGDPRYRCLLLTSDAFRSFDPAESTRARSCLESLTTADPSFSDGFSYLAALNNREFVYGFGRGADDSRALDRALQLARRGVELNPTSARSWQVLSTVLFSRHDVPAAFDAVQKALALNQNDLIILGEYGGRLITTGDIERGTAVLQRAGSDGGVRPSWHHFYFFLADYMRDRLPEATHEAEEMTSDTYTHGLFARALMAARNGDKAKAEGIWKKLVALRSAWGANPRGELDKYIFAPAILDRLMRDLEQSGLMRAH